MMGTESLDQRREVRCDRLRGLARPNVVIAPHTRPQRGGYTL